MVDQNKLDWLHTYQDNLCANVYNSLADNLTHTDVDIAQLSYCIVLLSSYTSGD